LEKKKIAVKVEKNNIFAAFKEQCQLSLQGVVKILKKNHQSCRSGAMMIY
jgi:hypothetical protein